MAGEWSYLVGRITGDGDIDIVETDVPIEVDSIDRHLSAPPTIKGRIKNEVSRLKKNGRPIFEPHNTAVFAVADGLLRGGGIYRKPTFDGPTWTLDVGGFTSYPQDVLYDGATYFVDEDPLNIFRHIWGHLQSQPHGNFGITIDPLTSPVRIGKELEEVQFRAETSPGVRELVSFEAGPRKLAWYQTFDLAKEIDDLAKDTPFDWVERLSWLGDDIGVHIGLGYPTIGSRKEHLRLVLDENLATEPSVSGGEFVNQVHVIGAGEGRQAVRGYAGRSDGRVRRPKVVQDKSVRSTAAANALAERILSQTRGELVIDTVEVYDHPNAPLEAIELGDTIPLYAETDWVQIEEHVRVIGRSDRPDATDKATLTVVRVTA